jgi:cytochrome c
MNKALALAPSLFAILVASAHAADAPSSGDAAAGRSRFMAQCSLCHSAEPDDGLGGMGPPLHGLIGKLAASIDKNFPYTPALRASKLAWDVATLDRFLTDPSRLVPGTSMLIATDDKAARAELIAYFLSLKAPAQRP